MVIAVNLVEANQDDESLVEALAKGALASADANQRVLAEEGQLGEVVVSTASLLKPPLS